MQHGIPIIVFTGLLMAASTAFTDELLIDSIHEAPVNSGEGIPRPTRGMNMEQVKRQYGEPAITHTRIGEPPITRWEYSDYSVFFEHQHVLTSVVHK